MGVSGSVGVSWSVGVVSFAEVTDTGSLGVSSGVSWGVVRI